MALLGWTKFAWQADYGQFYLIDREDAAFSPPQQFTAEMEARSFFLPPAGIVVYTNDCLQQHIGVSISDADPGPSPDEPMSGRAWTRVETFRARFPSKSFSISSPSAPDPLPCGPVFFLPAADVLGRISWMEFQGSRDDSAPVEPDVIDIVLWPA